MTRKEWEQGLVHLYIGDGKGKTSAAVGASIRAIGAGLRVVFAQFMKGRGSGELAVLAGCGVRVVRRDGSGKFVAAMDDAEKDEWRRAQREIFAEAAQLSAACDVLVLDEIFSAVATGMVGLDGVLALLATRPAGVEVILTGRDPHPAIVLMADYVSSLECRRHPYDKGVAARRGIEY